MIGKILTMELWFIKFVKIFPIKHLHRTVLHIQIADNLKGHFIRVKIFCMILIPYALLGKDCSIRNYSVAIFIIVLHISYYAGIMLNPFSDPLHWYTGECLIPNNNCYTDNYVAICVKLSNWWQVHNLISSTKFNNNVNMW